MTDLKDVEVAVDMKCFSEKEEAKIVYEKQTITRSIHRDTLEGLPKELLFTIDAGNSRGSVADVICPYNKHTCREIYCGIFDKKNHQCAVVTSAQNQKVPSPHNGHDLVEHVREESGIPEKPLPLLLTEVTE